VKGETKRRWDVLPNPWLSMSDDHDQTELTWSDLLDESNDWPTLSDG
jgi:hypothetical protein